ncbi:MAG: family 10 glycosylhydrolase [Carboxylicivirga sp.]|nr:family 10 glycosylhydrolase [Carboxylicivirga sp.]
MTHHLPAILNKFLALIFLFHIGNNANAQSNKYPKHEMRGVWVATVANIDWPSKSGLSVKEQKQEAKEIIEHCHQLGLNTIFLQVRPSCDVLYESDYEPWSKVLSGTAGKNPKYDPLEFWIEEAHQKGLELHAWINPYRASMNQKDKLPLKHPYHQTPGMFVDYGGKKYFNPGHPQSIPHICKVVKELVENYNIDGLHMDDYFYPYPVKDQTFPDEREYARYGRQFDDINAWRRDNVDRAIMAIQGTVKSSKPWLQFGISPFGVWRNKADDPKGSNTKAGATNYDALHADILKWMENKWIDYVVPQLYWGTSHPVANYNTLIDWWNENHNDVPIYIGHGIYKIGSDKPDWRDPQQMPIQLNSLKDKVHLNGSVFFSYKHFKRELMGFQDSLSMNFYRYKALVPFDEFNRKVNSPSIAALKASSKRLKWKTETKLRKDQLYKYIIYRYSAFEAFDPSNPQFIYAITYTNKFTFPKKTSALKKEYLFRVATINNYNEEGMLSEPIRVSY